LKLVITEKPSVAMSIEKVLGVKNRADGYMRGKVKHHNAFQIT